MIVGLRSVYRGDGRVDVGFIEVMVGLIDGIVGFIEVMIELRSVLSR